MGPSQRMEQSALTRRPGAVSLIVVAVGVTLALVLSHWMREREKQLLASAFEGRANDRIVAIDRAFNHALISVEAVAAHFHTAKETDRAQFRSFAKQFLDRHPSLQGLGYDPIVLRADRDRHEAAIRSEGLAHYQIVERNDAGDVVRAADRPEFVPVQFIEPLAGNEKALGYDIASEAVRRNALDRARETGLVTATGALRLVQETGSEVGILVCAPVYADEELRQNVIAFAVGVFRIGSIVDRVLEGFELGDVEVRMSDLGTVGGGRLYGREGASEPTHELCVIKTIPFAGRDWRIECHPTKSFLAQEFMWGGAATLAVVLLLTAIVSTYVFLLTGKNERLRHWIAQHERTKAELTAAHEWMGTALDAIDGGIWDIDLRHDRAHFSPGWAKMLGYEPNELTPTLASWEDRIHPDDRARVQAARQRQADGEAHALSLEYRVRTKSGDVKWVLDRGKVVEAVDGRPARITGTMLDITPRKNAEESMLQLNLAVENAMTGISRLDADGCFVMVRDAYAKMLGYTPQEMLGLSWEETVLPGDIEKGRAAFAAMLANGRSEVISNARRKDGSSFVKHILLVQIKNDQGEHDGHYCFMRDVTEQVAAEAAVRLRDRAIRSVSNGIVISDATLPDCPVVFVNVAFERMTGYAAHEVVGRNCRFLQGDERNQPGREILRKAIHAQEEARVVLRNFRKDGTPFWNEIFIAPVLDNDGQLTHFVGVLNDVTAREEAEAEKAKVESARRQSQKLEAVGTLASGIAHDFNNLLTAIEGHTVRASAELDDAHPANRALELVRQACDQATVVTRSLLTFSNRAETGRTTIDLATVARDSIELIQRLLPASIQIRESYPSEDIPIEGDRHQLQQVLMNLAINARDAMPDGGELHVELRRVSGSNGDARALLAVTDTGCGMSADTVARIFEPFFTTKQRGKGTGLGLSMVHGIVTDHNGSIDVQSQPERGTRIEIALPVCSRTACEQPSEDATAESQLRRGGGELILIAEDNELVRPLFAHALQSDGYNVIFAEDGEAALEMFTRHRAEVKLLVLDLDLPKKSGMECLQEIRGSGDETPVIIVSGNFDQAYGLDQQPNLRMLAKPFPMGKLQSVVEELLATVSKT